MKTKKVKIGDFLTLKKDIVIAYDHSVKSIKICIYLNHRLLIYFILYLML
jgi:hypothetical protein